MIDRRKFLAGTLAASAGATMIIGSNYAFAQDKQKTEKKQDSARQQPPPRPPQIDPKLVKQFVGNSHGNFKGVKELIGKEPMLINASWDWTNGDWETGLGAASHVGNRAIAEFLLDKGARIDSFAMAMLGHTDMLKAIAKSYPKFHTVAGPHGIPMLSHSIFSRDHADDCFEWILKSGADPNQTSNSGQTPLMAAASVGRVEIIQTLLDHEADPTLKDKKDRTALDYARSRKRDAAIKLLEKQ